MDNEKMIESIRSLCKLNNISPTKLEELLGFSQGLISRWKDKTPALDKIIDIADYFNVSLDEVVGYNHNINDNFLKLLYEKTSNNSIQWELGQKLNDQGYKVKIYDRQDVPGVYINEEIYRQSTYATVFNGGYIVMYAYYYFDKILKPEELILFIQPSNKAFLVDQHYNQDDLIGLWIKVLNNLREDIPDEVKAENLKNDFIQTSKLDSKNNKVIVPKTKKVLKPIPPKE